MPRQTYPRPDHHHVITASPVLARHASTVGAPVELPVPIELIIEQTYELEILWDDVPEHPDTVILGALAPRDRRIVLNVRHQALFEQYLGPERFTLAHELGHWIYDADDPGQLTLDLGEHPTEWYCYHRESPGLSEILRIRELNANKFAAHLLLPEDLVRRANIWMKFSKTSRAPQRHGRSHVRRCGFASKTWDSYRSTAKHRWTSFRDTCANMQVWCIVALRKYTCHGRKDGDRPQERRIEQWLNLDTTLTLRRHASFEIDVEHILSQL